MERWQGRVAMVTGASAGIGGAITEALANNGVVVIGLARRHERVKELAEKLKNAKGKVYAIKCDVTKEQDVVDAFKWAKEHLGGVDILINNAGVAYLTNVTDGEINQWRQMLELNVLAVGSCTKEFLKSMKERKLDDGHIINISSVVAHSVVSFKGFYIYSISKHAAKLLTEALRLELADLKSKIKVTNLSPGAVDTEIADAGGFANELPDYPKLTSVEVADTVIYALSTPQNVQISELTTRIIGER